MAGFHIGLRCSGSIFLALVFVQTSSAQIVPSTTFAPASAPTKPALADNSVNRVYSLADFGDDPNLCKWIAETIPRMVKPGCWNGQNLSYYAPAKVLAIYQTPAVHAQVEEFLADMRRSMPREKATVRFPISHPPIAQAQHAAPAQFNPEGLRLVGPASASHGYPVPLALQAPKHLFHFIIRYEGEGIIDSNVNKFAEVMTKAGALGASPSHSSVPLPEMPVPPPPPNGAAITPAAYFPPNGPASTPSRTMPPADSQPTSSTTPSASPGDAPLQTRDVLPTPLTNAPPPPVLSPRQ